MPNQFGSTPPHTHLYRAKANLAGLLDEIGDQDVAEDLFRQVLAGTEIAKVNRKMCVLTTVSEQLRTIAHARTRPPFIT